jgi:hypothetical protein
MLTPNHDGQWALPTGGNFGQTQRPLILSRTPVAGKAPWRSRLSSGHRAAGGPFPATTGLSFAGFSFPLLKPVLRVGDKARPWPAVTIVRGAE